MKRGSLSVQNSVGDLRAERGGGRERPDETEKLGVSDMCKGPYAFTQPFIATPSECESQDPRYSAQARRAHRTRPRVPHKCPAGANRGRYAPDPPPHAPLA